MRTSPAWLATLACAMTMQLTASRVSSEVLHTEPLRRQKPIPSGSNARVDEIGRGEKTSINFWEMGASGGMPPHIHKVHEEIIVVQGGRAEARIGEETLAVGPGDVLVVRPGTLHGARVIGTEPFYGVSVFSPGFDGQDRLPASAGSGSLLLPSLRKQSRSGSKMTHHPPAKENP